MCVRTPSSRRSLCLRSQHAVAAMMVACLLCGSQRASGDDFPRPAIYRSFDGPAVTWQAIDHRRSVKLLSHAIDGQQARQGSGSERIVVDAAGGESVRWACPVGRVPVLDETVARLWLKANRPGVLLGARIVLPRTTDPSTDEPYVALVPGDRYEQVGQWQQLGLRQVPKLLAREVRVMRTTTGATIDPREAYLDAIVLSIPGGPGSTAVWTDALSVDGIVLDSAAKPRRSASDHRSTSTVAVESASAERGETRPAASSPWRAEAARRSAGGSGAAKARLQGTTLTLDEKPFLSIGIERNAEPLSYLADRGLNTVWRRQTPSAEESAAAERAGVWFVCRPPDPDSMVESGLGDSLERVLAWNLGRPGEHDLSLYRRWAELIRNHDPAVGRPIFIAPAGDWEPYSELADVLVAEHPAASQLTIAQYAQWLDDVRHLSGPSTPLWAALPTQAGSAARHQATAALGPSAARPSVDVVQVEALAAAAATSGCRGFVFRSHAPLNESGRTAELRASGLELIARRLELIAPWLTVGRPIGQVATGEGTPAAELLQVERARLVVPHRRAAGGSAEATDLALVVPGIPTTNNAYLLTPAGMERLSTERIAGGTRVEVDSHNDAMILVTGDAHVITGLRRQLDQGARRSAILQRDLATGEARALREALGATSPQRDNGSSEPLATLGATELQRCNARLGAGDWPAAYHAASAARRRIAEALEPRRAETDSTPRWFSSPLGRHCTTLGEEIRFAAALEALSPEENQLYGGDFENLDQLTKFGWRHLAQPLPGIEPGAELTADTAHAGDYCLRLWADVADTGPQPQVIAEPLVSVQTPSLQVAEGEVLEISGWVRTTEPIVGSIDGLRIADSLGGKELALRVQETNGWEPFRMIRVARSSGSLTVTFALIGTGSVQLDGVMIRRLVRPTTQRLPQVESASLRRSPTPTGAEPLPAGPPR